MSSKNNTVLIVGGLAAAGLVYFYTRPANVAKLPVLQTNSGSGLSSLLGLLGNVLKGNGLSLGSGGNSSQPSSGSVGSTGSAGNASSDDDGEVDSTLENIQDSEDTGWLDSPQLSTDDLPPGSNVVNGQVVLPTAQFVDDPANNGESFADGGNGDAWVEEDSD